MTLLLGAEAVSVAWQPHPEVWILIGAVIALGLYVARVIAPKIPAADRGPALPDGSAPPAISRRQRGWFICGVALLWFASDWPMHDVAEQYLYFVHMIQHLILTLVLPPVFWLATPAWLARLVVAPGRAGWGVLRRLAHPVVAAVIFNALIVATHWAALVNLSVSVAPVHYLVHLTVVMGAFLMWIPVCGPWEELRLTPPGQCIYLFIQSIIPTVPGAWLTMAEFAVYSSYDHDPRLFDISVISDQQYAGLFMKIGGGAFLWAVIISIFFRWALALEKTEHRARIVTLEDGLTFETVQEEFERSEPAPSGTAD